MRTIEFRGKDIKGRWVYGAFVRAMLYGYPKIISINHDGTYSCAFDVDPNTVGQHSGMCDALGDGIYEGDILEECNTGRRVAVVYRAPEFCFKDNEFGYKFINHPENFYKVGNIYDNPELLEKGGTQ